MFGKSKGATLIVLLVTTLSAHAFFSATKRRENEKPLVGADLYFQKRNIPQRVTQANIGENVILTCVASGTPPPTIHWLYNGKLIRQGERTISTQYSESAEHNGDLATLSLSTTASRLTINCATLSDEAIYTCIAENNYLRIHTSTLLVLDSSSPPANEFCKFKLSSMALEPANIYMWTVNRLEFEGVNIQLFCRGQGNPPPNITWVDKNKEVIHSGENGYKILKSGDLLIRDIRFAKHMGKITCIASNSLGRDSRSAFVYPTIP